MDIKYLRYFVKTAEIGSINQAAKVLYISQPHLSFILKELEQEVGAALLERKKSGIRLTPKGRTFLQHCQNILKETEAIKKLSDQQGSETLKLHVSCTRFTEIAECFTAVCRKYQTLPDYSCRLKEDSPFQVIEDVAEGRSEIGVFHFSTREEALLKAGFKDRNLSFEEVARFVPHIAVSSEHPLLRKKEPVTLDTAARYGLIRYIGEYEDFFYRVSEGDRHIDLNEYPRVIYVNDREAQLRLLAKTDCFTIGIQNFAEQEKRFHVQSFPIRESSEKLIFGILIRKDHNNSLTPIEMEFIDSVRLRFQIMQKNEQNN